MKHDGGTSRHQSASKEAEENKKSIKIIMFDSHVSLVNRSHDLEKKKKEHSRILAWSQRNAMALECCTCLKLAASAWQGNQAAA